PPGFIPKVDLLYYPTLPFRQPGLAKGESQVKTQHKKGKVKTQPQPGIDGELVKSFLHFKFRTRAGGISPKEPYVTGIGKHGAFNNTHHSKPQFRVYLQLDVPRFIGLKPRAFRMIITRPQRPGTKSSQAIASPDKKLFYKRQAVGISIGKSVAHKKPVGP